MSKSFTTPAAAEAGVGAPTRRSRGMPRGGRCCSCCSSRICRCLLVAGGILFAICAIYGIAAGVTYASCSADVPKSIETGTLDLTKVAGGTINIGDFDIGLGGTYTISAPSAATTASSNTTLTYIVTKYTSRSNPDPHTADIDGATWTLHPWGGQSNNVWSWTRALRFDFNGLCTKTDLSIVLPDGSAALTAKMSLSVATSNAGIKLSGPGQSWSKVDIWTRNGDIRTTDDAKFALGGIFNAQSTNGRIELGAISLAAGAKVDLDSTYGGITLGAAPATSTSAFSIKLFSVDGGATVKMPSNSSFTYSLSTTSGSKTVMGAKGASSGVNGDSKAAQDRAINIGTVNSDIKITTL